MVENAVQERTETQAPPPAPAIDSGLLGLALIAGYYRIAADPAQLKHQLAIIGRFAVSDDIVRGSNLLGLKSRILRRVTAARLGKIPYPALMRLADGGFVALGQGSAKGRVRLVDPVTRIPSDVTLEEAHAMGAGEIVLIARRIGGSGFDPTTCLLYTSPSPRDGLLSRMPSSA